MAIEAPASRSSTAFMIFVPYVLWRHCSLPTLPTTK
jgi:hypothetical protein